MRTRNVIYSNHLSTASLELDENAAIISYEEYHPYGTTAYQAMNASINAVAKRYRYTGKERDEETGLYYHGARYYIPWLCRWTAVDPMENRYAGMSPYNYGFCNPIIWQDTTGMEPDKQEGTEQNKEGDSDRSDEDGDKDKRENNANTDEDKKKKENSKANEARTTPLPTPVQNPTAPSIKPTPPQTPRPHTPPGESPIGIRLAQKLAPWGRVLGTILLVFTPAPMGTGDIPRHYPTTDDLVKEIDNYPKPDLSPDNNPLPQDNLRPTQQPTGHPEFVKEPEPENDKYIYRSGSASYPNLTPRPGKDDGTGIKSGLSFWTTEELARSGDLKAKIYKISVEQLLKAGFEVNIDKDGHVGVRPPSQETLREWAKTRPGLSEGKLPHPLSVILRMLVKKIN